jgi:hypothetical protein
VLLPVAALVVKDAPPAREIDGVLVAASPTTRAVMDSVVSLASLDRALAAAWLVSTATLLALLAAGCVVTWLRRRRWTPHDVDGVGVLVSDDLGPAVVGFLRGTIVLPAWALSADARDRSMMLRHEQEHLAAGDPRLLLLAALAVALMPWNVAIWYVARRIRLAIEVDCDRRVMRAGDMDLRSYAELLIQVGARRKLPAHAVGFSVGRPFLEHRIDRLTDDRRVGTRRRAAVAVVGVALALTAAWALPQPVTATDVSDAVDYCPDSDTRPVTQALLQSMEWST